MRRALVVRGGWPGHAPVECTDKFLPFLREQGFEIEVLETPEVYADRDRMSTVDLVVQSWSMGEISDKAARGLSAAVRAGTGFAGWHGGVVDAFDALPYLHLTGGRFVYHPTGPVKHELTVVRGHERHPIMAGITAVPLETEKYWVLTDPLCDVLATVAFPVDQPGDPEDRGDVTPWRREVTIPAVWTREWGNGRVFVHMVGHRVEDLNIPEIEVITERGLLWAARDQ